MKRAALVLLVLGVAAAAPSPAPTPASWCRAYSCAPAARETAREGAQVYQGRAWVLNALPGAHVVTYAPLGTRPPVNAELYLGALNERTLRAASTWAAAFGRPQLGTVTAVRRCFQDARATGRTERGRAACAYLDGAPVVLAW